MKVTDSEIGDLDASLQPASCSPTLARTNTEKRDTHREGRQSHDQAVGQGPG